MSSRGDTMNKEHWRKNLKVIGTLPHELNDGIVEFPFLYNEKGFVMTMTRTENTFWVPTKFVHNFPKKIQKMTKYTFQNDVECPICGGEYKENTPCKGLRALNDDGHINGFDEELLGIFGEKVKEFYNGLMEKHRIGKAKEIGRNDPCLCGSGKKYKKCCGM